MTLDPKQHCNLMYCYVHVILYSWAPAEIFVGGGKPKKGIREDKKDPHMKKKVAERPHMVKKALHQKKT